LDGQIWALKAASLTSPLIVTVTDTSTIRKLCQPCRDEMATKFPEHLDRKQW